MSAATFVTSSGVGEPYAPVLQAVGVAADGSAIVTAQALADFVQECAANDPNGTWLDAHVCTDGGPHEGWLCLSDADEDDPSLWAYFPRTDPPLAEPTWTLTGWHELHRRD